MLLLQLAATTVVATAIVTAVVAATIVVRTTTIAVTAEQNEDYKDDNPGTVITIVEKATHFFNPLSMHNMMF